MIGIAFGLINATNMSWLGRIAPTHSRGKIFSGFTTILFLGELVSPIIVQAIQGTLYDAYVFLGIAGIALGLLFAVVSITGIDDPLVVIAENPVRLKSRE
jgi:MFS family permease